MIIELRIGYQTSPHNQETGRMQLMKRLPHENTGHKGGFSMWGKVDE